MEMLQRLKRLKSRGNSFSLRFKSNTVIISLRQIELGEESNVGDFCVILDQTSYSAFKVAFPVFMAVRSLKPLQKILYMNKYSGEAK